MISLFWVQKLHESGLRLACWQHDPQKLQNCVPLDVDPFFISAPEVISPSLSHDGIKVPLMKVTLMLEVLLEMHS